MIVTPLFTPDVSAHQVRLQLVPISNEFLEQQLVQRQFDMKRMVELEAMYNVLFGQHHFAVIGTLDIH